MRGRIYRVIVAAMLASGSMYMPAHAGVVEDAWGIATDPLKLGRAANSAKEVAASVERTVAELKALESQTNLDVRDRISQIDDIVQSLEAAVSANVSNIGDIVDTSLSKISTIETQTNLDAINLIYRAQCASQVVVDQQLPKAIQDTLDRLNKSRPGISVFGVKIIEFKAQTVPIDDPDIAYRQLRKIYYQRLGDLKPDSDAWWIVSAYSNLERLARLARCNYIDQPTHSIYFNREINDLERLSAPWQAFVKL